MIRNFEKYSCAFASILQKHTHTHRKRCNMACCCSLSSIVYVYSLFSCALIHCIQVQCLWALSTSASSSPSTSKHVNVQIREKDRKWIPPGITRDWAGTRPAPPNKARINEVLLCFDHNQSGHHGYWIFARAATGSTHCWWFMLKLWRWANRNLEVLQKLPKKSGDDQPLTKLK